MNKNNDVNSMNLAENNLDYTNMQICALSDLHLHLKQSIVGTAHKYSHYTNTEMQKQKQKQSQLSNEYANPRII